MSNRNWFKKTTAIICIFLYPQLNNLAGAQAQLKMADLALIDAVIYTVNEKQPFATAVAIADGTIIYVGENDGLEDFIDDQTKVISLRQQMLLPGFIDTHSHIFEGASQVGGNCQLEKNANLKEQIPSLKICRQNISKKGAWVIGHGFQLDALMDHQLKITPIRLLDEVFPNNPVVIMEESSHAMLVNSYALHLAKLNSSATPPPGGRIMIDPDTREPNGILFDNAGDIVMEIAWNSAPDVFNQSYAGLLAGMNEVIANGITTIGDGRMYWRRNWYEVWQQALKDDQVKVRTSIRPWIYPELSMSKQLKFLEEIYQPDPEELLIVNQVKMYADGVLHFGTAKLSQPYQTSWQTDIPSGLNYIPPDQLSAWLKQLNKIGYGAHIHAVGDAGINEALNAIEQSRKQGSQQKYALTHLEMVNDKDIARFKSLNVDADFQAGAEFFGDHSWVYNLIGKKRASKLLPMRKIFDTGANVTFSSDWTVNPLNPLVAIANSTRLKHTSGLPNIHDAIKAATINGAKALGIDKITGSIEVGKSADLVVLSDDITQLSPQQILETEIVITILQGEVVYVSVDE
ncbi:amidohydrolase [Aliikangiella coralliicola]|uniref:Amidohydrolase n=1 Tax=Aliikangiella coralliicola TaxID=2592383 RepID=A0A545UD76_9GAMM|nr:amidohydrolase [Aliikangiella coralliicola]TQV87416.1 amidohydrolase [Aliikangiella coralliicola]